MNIIKVIAKLLREHTNVVITTWPLSTKNVIYLPDKRLLLLLTEDMKIIGQYTTQKASSDPTLLSRTCFTLELADPRFCDMIVEKSLSFKHPTYFKSLP